MQDRATRMRLDHRLHVDLAQRDQPAWKGAGPRNPARFGRKQSASCGWITASFKLIDKDGSLTGPQILRA